MTWGIPIWVYGGEIDTPNIDALAGGGIRFSHFKIRDWRASSRASLLTGRHQHAVGLGWMTAVDEHRPGYRRQIAKEIPILAEIMKENGYTTYMAGKWHLTVDGAWKPEIVPLMAVIRLRGALTDIMEAFPEPAIFIALKPCIETKRR